MQRNSAAIKTKRANEKDVPRQGSEYGHGCAARGWGWSSESGIFGNSIACRKCLQDGFATSARIVGNTEADHHAPQLLKNVTHNRIMSDMAVLNRYRIDA
jgi:hypothetical protein